MGDQNKSHYGNHYDNCNDNYYSNHYDNRNSDYYSSGHIFEYHSIEKKKLILSLVITLIVMMLEIIGGIFTNSIALISDAGHMFTHAFALTICLIAIFIASKPPCHHRTFGLYRAEILAAFINGLLIILVVGVIIYEAIVRFLDPRDVHSLQMLGVAMIGLVTNIASILILHGSHKDDLNIKGVFYHMGADAVSSMGIVFCAIIIFYTGWNIIDPLVSLGISMVIIFWAVGLLKESTRVLLEMAPKGMDVDTIGRDLESSFPGIKRIYDVHLWSITPKRIVFSAHVKLHNSKITLEQQSILTSRINNHLARKYRISGTTIQIAAHDDCEECNLTSKER